MNEEIIINGLYRHFKNKEYQVIAVARDCEDPERQLVVYKALYESSDYGYDQVWVRELSDFIGYKENPGGEKIKRFTFIGKN